MTVFSYIVEQELQERKEKQVGALSSELLQKFDQLDIMAGQVEDPKAKRLIKKILSRRKDLEDLSAAPLPSQAEGVLTIGTVLLQIFTISVRLLVLLKQLIFFRPFKIIGLIKDVASSAQAAAKILAK